MSARTRNRLREHSGFRLVKIGPTVEALGGVPGALLECTDHPGGEWLGWLPIEELPDELIKEVGKVTAYGDAYGFVAELTFLANQYRETIVSQYQNHPIIAEPGKDALSTYREWRNYEGRNPSPSAA